MLKEFTSLYIISEIDNLAFRISAGGFFGQTLYREAQAVKKLAMEEDPRRNEEGSKRKDPKKKKLFAEFCILIVLIGSWIALVRCQQTGTIVKRKFKGCEDYVNSVEESNPRVLDQALDGKIDWWEKITDGECDSLFNNENCGFDGGDCSLIHAQYPSCTSDEKIYNYNFLGNSKCNLENNDFKCSYDGGDCREFNRRFPKFMAQNKTCLNKYLPDANKLGDGKCNLGVYNSAECEYDIGDCEAFNNAPRTHDFEKKYPKCIVEDANKLGDRRCNLDLNTEDCGYDLGDCKDVQHNCSVSFPEYIGDGFCDQEEYNTPECGFDGGDCKILNALEDCRNKVQNAKWIGDGKCDGAEYNTEECLWDGFDCVSEAYQCAKTDEKVWKDAKCNFYEVPYPDCNAANPEKIGDGYCNIENNSTECDFDGSDCDDSNGYICFQEERMTWESSLIKAKELNANLVKINCADQNLRVTLLTSEEVWIGATDAKNEGEWEWEYNTTNYLDYKNWAPNQPDNNAGNQNCAVINWIGKDVWSGRGGFGTWDDNSCSHYFKAVYQTNTEIEGMKCIAYPSCF